MLTREPRNARLFLQCVCWQYQSSCSRSLHLVCRAYEAGSVLGASQCPHSQLTWSCAVESKSVTIPGKDTGVRDAIEVSRYDKNSETMWCAVPVTLLSIVVGSRARQNTDRVPFRCRHSDVLKCLCLFRPVSTYILRHDPPTQWARMVYQSSDIIATSRHESRPRCIHLERVPKRISGHPMRYKV